MGPRRGRARKVLVVMVALLGLGGLCCAGAAWGGLGAFHAWVETRPGYSDALAVAAQDAELQDRLGTPLLPGEGMSWDPLIPGVMGPAWSFEVELGGPKGAGTLRGAASIQGDGAVLDRLTFSDPVYEDELDLLVRARDAQKLEDEQELERLVTEGLNAARMGDPDLALGALDQVLAADGDNVRALLARGSLLLEQGALDKAQVDLEQATVSAVTAGDAWLALGTLHAERRDYQACVDAYTEALRTLPARGDAWWGRARCYRGQGDMARFQAGAREACAQGIPEACTSAQR